MTIDEAIKNREDCLKYLEEIGQKASPECVEAVRWSIKALKTLRPVSRERVEKVWRGEWIDKPTGRYGQWQTWCSACGKHSGIGGIKSNRHRPFCPNCGAPMTDEAVEIRLKELETLKDD